jgi:hypothetical protein
MDQRTTITSAAASRKATPTGDASWRVSWKDGVGRNIRFAPLDGVAEQNWSHTVYRTKTAGQTVQAQARPVLPDEVDRKLSREPEREVPWACANRQHQDLALMTAEPCRCNPEQVRCCAEQLATVTHSEAMLQHDHQVAWMQAAAGYLLKDNPAWLRPYGEGSGTFDCLPPWKRIVISDVGRWTRLGWAVSRGVRLQHEKWRERRFRSRDVDRLADQEIGAAFVATLYVADDLDAEFSRQHERTIGLYCDAPTLSARCYQAAAAVLTAYYDHGLLNVAEHDILAARIVTEVFDNHLQPRRIKQRSNVVDDHFIVTRMLDKSEDLSVSAYKIAKLHGLEASTVRKRFDRKLEDIESQLSKYCNGYNALAYYPQTVSRPCYNIISDRAPVAERFMKPRELERPQPYRKKINRNWLFLGTPGIELPPGTACHYSGTSEVDRDYPAPPYGAEPLQIWLPQPPHKFTHEVSTQLLPERTSRGLPFDDKFERHSVSWLNKGVVHNGRADIKAAKNKKAQKAAVKDTRDLMDTWVAPAAMAPNNIPLFD